jgi:TM2 domain-containing membrane protein YozV
MTTPVPNVNVPADSAREPKLPDQLQPVAAILALAFPGAGHVYLGYRKRGVLISVGVLYLFLTGLLVGGLASVDSREEPIWFLGQALTGPLAFGVDALHQNQFKVREAIAAPAGQPQFRVRAARPLEYRDPATGKPVPISVDSAGASWAMVGGTKVSPAYPPYVRGVGRMQELGMLFCTIAGFMNLICVIDAGLNRRSVRSARGALGGSGS